MTERVIRPQQIVDEDDAETMAIVQCVIALSLLDNTSDQMRVIEYLAERFGVINALLGNVRRKAGVSC